MKRPTILVGRGLASRPQVARAAWQSPRRFLFLLAISAVSDEDYSVADPLLGTLQLTASYAGMSWGGSLLGFGNGPGEILNDNVALQAATSLFEAPCEGLVQ